MATVAGISGAEAGRHDLACCPTPLRVPSLTRDVKLRLCSPAIGAAGPAEKVQHPISGGGLGRPVQRGVSVASTSAGL